VREWLLDLSRDDRKAIGCDIKTAQYGLAYWNAPDSET
jgi:hypothetical protein